MNLERGTLKDVLHNEAVALEAEVSTVDELQFVVNLERGTLEIILHSETVELETKMVVAIWNHTAAFQYFSSS